MYVEQEVSVDFPSNADSRERRQRVVASAGQQQHLPVVNRGKVRHRGEDADRQYSRGEVTSRRVIGRGASSAVDLPGVAEPRFIDSGGVSEGDSARSGFHRGNDRESDTCIIRRLAHAVSEIREFKNRVSLAAALFSSPDVLLLDEPTNHLDIGTVIWLEEFLAGYEKTLVVVSHDRHFLNEVCSDILLIKDQQLLSFRGNYDTYEKVFEEERLNRERERASIRGQIDHLMIFINRFRVNANRAP